jgi:hypothetical protein
MDGLTIFLIGLVFFVLGCFIGMAALLDIQKSNQLETTVMFQGQEIDELRAKLEKRRR